ncbi:MAG: hypothetical protein J6P95_06730, partial [Paludibacteraceae bacterium]|nr:hypothetical protein [Paludibacteraceae bacterium]
MKKNFLFVAMLFATLSLGFVGCEKSDDLLENGNEDMDISINSDSIVDNLLQDIDPNGNVVDSKPTAPALPEFIATGGSSDTWYSSVTLWGRLNPDKFTSIKEWGIECSTSKQELLSHKATKKSSVAGFVGENNDEFFVFFRGVGNGKKLYYNAYVQTNDMQYVYGNIDSVQMLVKLTVESNNTSYGTVKGSDYYKVGEEVTITATPSRGYTFVKWNDGNTDNPRIITAEKTDITYTANFELFVSGTENGFGYIDLGLPSGLKWATCNVGADSPEEYGDYFAWGETTSKTTYDWSTYKWCNGSYYTMTKYCDNSYYGIVDDKTVLDPEDDAAFVNMGGSWRMPTKAEQD